MPKTKYFFQKKKRNFTRKFFEKGLTAASYILFALKESGEVLASELPSCYPGLKLMKDLFGGSYKGPEFKKDTIRVNVRRLKDQGLIRKDEKREIYLLTDKGKELLTYIQDRYLIMNKEWDGKLRIVIFDIPEAKKYWRKWLREELLLLQFQQLQKSVYIGKYPLPESLYQDIAKKNLSPYVFVLTAGEIDKKEDIIKIFNQD